MRTAAILLLLAGCCLESSDRRLAEAYRDACDRGDVHECLALGEHRMAGPPSEFAEGQAAYERACRLGALDSVRAAPAVNRFDRGWIFPAEESDGICAYLLDHSPERFTAEQREAIHRRTCLDARYLQGKPGGPFERSMCEALAAEATARGDSVTAEAARHQLEAWSEPAAPAP
jgi:hypothetical protein